MLKELGLKKNLILAASIIGVFLLVYSPHFSYPYPYHIDEWHHIDQSILFGNYGAYFESLRNEWVGRFSGLEIGFHLFLFLLNFAVNIVTFYKFLPALWASAAAAILFFITYKKTKGNFLISWLAILFFASIKTNVNITGLWFFTPLTFAIPFIFLYFYFYSEGLVTQNKKYVLYAFLIMLGLIPTHSVSVLFAFPALLTVSLVHFRYILKEYKFFALYLLIPFVGILFYKDTLQVSWVEVIGHAFAQLQFRRGWGVLELNNSIFEVYSFIGYCLGIIGFFYLVISKKVKQNLAYILWPLVAVSLVISFKATGVSFFSPYQRNLYYLALGLPLLSAYGVYGLYAGVKALLARYVRSEEDADYVKKAVLLILIFVSFIGAFAKYKETPEYLGLYQVIDKNDYNALKYIRDLPPGKILATPYVSTAAYSVSNHKPYATIYFDSDFRWVVEDFFFGTNDCDSRLKLLDGVYTRVYIVTPTRMDCGEWVLIYDEGTKIYRIN